MHTVEFKPKFFAIERVMILVFMTVLFGIILYFTAYSSYKLYLQYPEATQLRNSALLLVTAFSLMELFIILAFIYATKTLKIVINDTMVTFHRRSLFKGVSTTSFDLSETSLVDLRQETTFMFTGKTLVPIVHYWLVFHNGGKKEVLLDGWDKSSLREGLTYIKSKFPSIKFNAAPFLRDSSEVLAGLTS